MCVCACSYTSVPPPHFKVNRTVSPPKPTDHTGRFFFLTSKQKHSYWKISWILTVCDLMRHEELVFLIVPSHSFFVQRVTFVKTCEVWLRDLLVPHLLRRELQMKHMLTTSIMRVRSPQLWLLPQKHASAFVAGDLHDFYAFTPLPLPLRTRPQSWLLHWSPLYDSS